MRVAVEKPMSAQLRKVALRRSPGQQCTVHASSVDFVQIRDLDALQKLHAQHLRNHRINHRPPNRVTPHLIHCHEAIHMTTAARLKCPGEEGTARMTRATAFLVKKAAQGKSCYAVVHLV